MAFSQPLAQWLKRAGGISPWWAVPFFAITVVLELAKANYRQFRPVEIERDRLAAESNSLRSELREWRPDGPAGDIKKQAVAEFHDLKLRELDGVCQLLPASELHNVLAGRGSGSR